jgi:hypothetical protein
MEFTNEMKVGTTIIAEVKKIQDIPGFEILLMNSLAQKAAPGSAGAGPNQPGLTGLLHGGAAGQF